MCLSPLRRPTDSEGAVHIHLGPQLRFVGPLPGLVIPLPAFAALKKLSLSRTALFPDFGRIGYALSIEAAGAAG